MLQYQSIGNFLNLRRLEPLIGIALACHGALMLSHLNEKTEHWVLIAAVALLSLLALVPQFKSHNALQGRAIIYTLITAYLITTTGASKSFFLLWYVVIISYYPLVLGSACGITMIVFIVAFYLSTLLYQQVGLPTSVVLARTLLLSFIGVLSFILSYRLRAFDRLEILANTDSLTGLKNRRYFFELAENEFNRSKRYQNKLCMIIADVNNFKNINDSYGHALGDEALKLCAKLLKQQTREIDVVCRLGGDEFAILLPQTDWEHANKTILRLNNTFSTHQLKTAKKPITISMSFGLAELSDEVNDVTELYKNADLSMYKNKSEMHKEILPV